MMWKRITKVDGNYEVSRDGRIRNGKTGRILAMTKHTGYYAVTVKPHGRGGKSVCLRVHRCVAEAWVDGYFDGAVVNHKDGNKLNSCAENLEWVTLSENTLHAHALGLLVNPKGTESKNCRLTDEQIVQIKADTRPQRVVAKEYGVGKTTIQNIHAGIRH